MQILIFNVVYKLWKTQVLSSFTFCKTTNRAHVTDHYLVLRFKSVH